jgi:transcriptional regulator with XRE-family HTH domain
MPTPDSLGATLRAARLDRASQDPRRYSVRALAARLGASASWLSMVERDVQRPTEEMVRALADELGLEPDHLLPQAGRVPADVIAVLLERPALVEAVRAMRAVSDADVARTIRQIHDGEW